MSSSSFAMCRYCGAPIIPTDTWTSIAGAAPFSHADVKVNLHHQAKPLIVDQDRLLQLKQELNRLPPNANYHVNERVLHMTMAFIDKKIGRPLRLTFLEWAFDAIITTSKVSQPGAPIEGGLQPHEAMGILTWAGPSNASGEWAYRPVFFQDLRLIQIHIGQQQSFLVEE